MTANNFKYLIISIFLMTSLIFIAPAAAAGAQDLSEKRADILNRLVQSLNNGNFNEAGPLILKIPSIISFTEEQRKQLFEAFYNCFVKLTNSHNFDDTFGLTTEWKRLYPDERLVSLYYGTLLSETGRTDEAIEQLQKGLTLKEEYRKIDNPLLMATYYNLGSIYFDLGEWNRVLDYADKISSIDANHPAIDFLKCRTLFYLSRYDEGMKYCEDSFKKNKKYATIVDYLTYAGYYRIRKDYTKSLEIVIDAINNFPLADGLYITAAADHIKMGQYYEGLMLLEREDMLISGEGHGMEYITELLGEIQKATEKKEDENSKKTAIMLQALDLLKLKNYKDALTKFDSLNENRTVYRTIIEAFKAQALVEMGKTDEAIETLKEITQKEPLFILAHLKLAELYIVKFKNREKAVEHYKIALHLKPNHWMINRVKDLLDKQE
jgi:tetratricopeptide (TPR) repeat protein